MNIEKPPPSSHEEESFQLLSSPLIDYSQGVSHQKDNDDADADGLNHEQPQDPFDDADDLSHRKNKMISRLQFLSKTLKWISKHLSTILLTSVYIGFVILFVVHKEQEDKYVESYAIVSRRPLFIDLNRGSESKDVIRTWFALSPSYYLYYSNNSMKTMKDDDHVFMTTSNNDDDDDFMMVSKPFPHRNHSIHFKFEYNVENRWLPVENQTFKFELPDITKETPPLTRPEDYKEGNGAKWFEFRTVGQYYWQTVDGDATKMQKRPLSQAPLRIAIETDSLFPVPFSMDIFRSSKLVDYRVLFAALILVSVYILIIFDLVHRTIAAMLGAMVTLSTLTVLKRRPSFEEVAHWIKFETVGLLFGMMIMVGVYSKTGFFEFMAIKAYKISRGKIWLLTLILCIFTAIVSAVLDNVTTILLLIPVSIRLCKVINISPIPLMISIVMMSNIGGGSTAVGDLVLIVNNPDIRQRGITFFKLSLYIIPSTIMNIIATMLLIRFVLFRNIFTQKPILNDELLAKEKEIEIWMNSLRQIGDCTVEEKQVRQMLMKHVDELNSELEIIKKRDETFVHTVDIDDLEKQYPIHDKRLFFICSAVLVLVVLMFFCAPFFRSFLDLSLPWIAVIGATSMLLLANLNGNQFAEIVEKVEWVTLLFFGSLFMLMSGVEELGLIDFVGSSTSNIILQIDERYRLVVAITIIMWASAFVSALIDNVACVSAFIPVVLQLADGANMPIAPLVWSVALGVTLGGNGTLIGASANLIAAGIAEQEHTPISFFQFLKAGMPTLLVTISIANIYLICVHVWWKIGLA